MTTLLKALRLLMSESGDISMMRTMSSFSLGIGAVIALYGVYQGKDLCGLAQVCGVFVGAAFGGKAFQKKYEE